MLVGEAAILVVEGGLESMVMDGWHMVTGGGGRNSEQDIVHRVNLNAQDQDREARYTNNQLFL